MSERRLVIIVLSVGIGLVAFSWVWPSIVGGRRAWTNSDAQQLQDATAKYHMLKYQYRAALDEMSKNPKTKAEPTAGEGRNSPATRSRYAEAKDLADRFAQTEERYRGLNAKLKRAKSKGENSATAMRWIGIVAIIIGALGYVTHRSSSTS